MSIHAARGVRTMNSNSLLQNSQIIALDTDIDNQAKRSRCVEIKMQAFKRYIVIEETVEIMRKHIMLRYAKHLSKQHRTITDRRAAVDAILSDSLRTIKRLNNVMKLADMVIEDTTAAGFTLKRIGDILQLRAKER